MTPEDIVQVCRQCANQGRVEGWVFGFAAALGLVAALYGWIKR